MKMGHLKYDVIRRLPLLKIPRLRGNLFTFYKPYIKAYFTQLNSVDWLFILSQNAQNYAIGSILLYYLNIICMFLT